MSSYGIERTVDLSFDQAVTKVTDELKGEGFGILTTIDVRDTLKKKLNVDFHNYIILGACNPPLAHRVLEADDQAGLLLPCNVVVQESGGRTRVSAFDPLTMGKIMVNPEVEPLAAEVRKKLERVIAKV
jgi:uncharacterized protein (DUF302 family)